MYAIRQTYTHYETGEHWTRIIHRRWKTYQGAQKVADRLYSWVTKPDGKTAIDNSDAEVIEVGA